MRLLENAKFNVSFERNLQKQGVVVFTQSACRHIVEQDSYFVKVSGHTWIYFNLHRLYLGQDQDITRFDDPIHTVA